MLDNMPCRFIRCYGAISIKVKFKEMTFIHFKFIIKICKGIKKAKLFSDYQWVKKPTENFNHPNAKRTSLI